jgi:two-component system sensor histidine kinase CpxA
MAERLEGLVTSQQQLLRDVSHELRSPLARLQVALGLARKRTDGKASAELDRIELETERLDHLIGQILALTRLERQLVGEQSDLLEFADLVANVVEDARYEAQAKKRSVKLTTAAPCPVNGRPQLLHSAVENVVRNAVRYTREGTTVDVSMNVEGGKGEWVTVLVRDHGPGVPDAALADLFEPFYRVEDGRERQSGGFGIGLAIAERTIRNHGGSMQAKNHEDGGLVVTLRLPVAQAG